MADELNRRAFATHLAAFAAVPVAISTLGADETGTQKSATPGVEKSPLSVNLSQVDLIVECVKRQYPDPHLDDAVLGEIRDDVAQQLGRSAILSRFPLQNSDEPATVFAPFRLDEPKGRGDQPRAGGDEPRIKGP